MSQPAIESKVRKSARDLVVDFLREGILADRFKPGARLNVGDLRNVLDVSHTPIREAFQHLAAEGLIWISPYKGVYVAQLSAEEYEEIYLMRIGLEGLAARLGAEFIDDLGLEAMGLQLDRMAETAKEGDIDAFIDSDREFHRRQYRAPGRERLWERIIALRYVAERYTRLSFGLANLGMLDVVASHRVILGAVAERNAPLAEELTVADLRLTYDAVSKELVKKTEVR